MPKIGFRPISFERIDGLGSYFAYIFLLTIPNLELSHGIFVSPAKQKRDICTAFPAVALLAAAAA